MERRRDSPTPVHRSLVVGAVAGLLFMIGVVLWYAAAVPLLFFAGILVAVAIDVPARWLARSTPLSRFWAAAVVVALLATLGAGVGLAAGPSVGRQFEQLSQQLPESVAGLRERLEQTTWGRTLLGSLWPQEGLPAPSAEAVGQITGLFSSALWAVSAALVVVFTGLFLAFEPELYIAGALRLVPAARRGSVRQVLGAAGQALRWWWVARIGTMTVDAGLIAIGLWLLGIPLALVLGLLAGVLAFIPNIGPVLSFVPAGLIALAQGPMMVLWVAMLYLAVQLVESYIITPMIDRKAVSLPPAVLLTAQVLMGLLGGVPGLLVASPLTVVVVVIVQKLYIEGFLGERVEVLGEHRG